VISSRLDRPAVPLVRSLPRMRPAFEGDRWILFSKDAKID